MKTIKNCGGGKRGRGGCGSSWAGATKGETVIKLTVKKFKIAA